MVFFHLYESYEGQSSKTLTLTLVRFRVYIPCVFAHIFGHVPTWHLGICPPCGHLPTWVWQEGICPLMQIRLNDDMSLDWWG